MLYQDRALVLGGGGAYYTYEVGAFRVLAEAGYSYPHIFGVSAGALLGTTIAQYELGRDVDAADESDEIIEDIRGNKDIYKRWWPFGMLHFVLRRRSLVNSKPLWKIIRRHCDQEAVINSGRTLRLGCCSWGDGNYHEAKGTDPDLWKWVVASSAFAPYFCPIKINGDWWYDGGYRHVVPLKSAIDAGYTKIDVICTQTLETRKKDPAECKNGMDVGMRLIGQMSDQIVLNDVQKALMVNDLVDAGHPRYEGKKKLDIRLIHPSRPFRGGSRNFDPELLQEHRARGIADAQRVLLSL